VTHLRKLMLDDRARTRGVFELRALFLLHGIVLLTRLPCANSDNGCWPSCNMSAAPSNMTARC
jgi:hypothetical protein